MEFLPAQDVNALTLSNIAISPAGDVSIIPINPILVV